MTIAFRAKAETSSAVSVDITINKPSGTIDGDIMIATIAESSLLGLTPPVGWTEIISARYTTVNWTSAVQYNMSVWWKRALSEGASYTWTHLSASCWGAIVSFSGCIDSGDPTDGLTPVGQEGGSQSCTALAINTTVKGAMAIMLWMNQSNTGAVTTPAGYTEYGFPNDTFGYEARIIGNPSTTSNQTETFTNSDHWAAVLIALKPKTVPVQKKRMLMGVGL